MSFSPKVKISVTIGLGNSVELIAAGNVPRAWARADTRSSF
jgi:hypothetical protein